MTGDEVIDYYDIKNGEDASDFVMNFAQGMELKYGMGMVVTMVLGRALFEISPDEFSRCVKNLAERVPDFPKVDGQYSKLA